MTAIISRFGHQSSADLDELRPSEHSFSPFTAVFGSAAALSLISTVLSLIAQG